MALVPGTRLGAYEIVAPLGAGGMGEVYRARDTKLGRDVALKVLADSFALDPERLARFKREAQVLASLNHPSIGAIYGLEEANGITGLVLELVEGSMLADRIAQGPIPLDEALPIATQIAAALEAAHAKGIIHRDLKPTNIMVIGSGRVKVLDFGIAKLAAVSADCPTLPLTIEGLIIGTPSYMSPEQAQGRPSDVRSDVFSFGSVLYEMLTGCRPFTGDSHEAVIGQVAGAKPPSLADVGANIPAGLERIVFRCLEKDPAARYQSGTELGPGMYGAERYQGGWNRRQPRDLNEPMVFATPGTIGLTPTAAVPAGMIRVPSGTYARGGRPPVQLRDYWLDRYEVTNADFKRFVDTGGYDNPAYWSAPLVKAGTAAWAQGTGEFRDKTGRPGPSTWVLSTYPEGQAELPVSGVSWYEAAAYCAFAEKRLPTIYHWFVAAGPANSARPLHDTWSPILGFSNFDGTSPARGGQFTGLSPYGAYDMAGNVKEWVWNEAGDERRYILGGAWNEPSYMFTRMDAAPAFARFDTYGFRCAKLSTPLSDDDLLLAGVPIATGRDYAKEQPVSDHEFALFKSHYVYDRTELNAAVEILDGAHPQWREEKASFDAAYRRERMSAHLFLPKNARPPYQAVVYFPAGGAFGPNAVLQVRSLDFIVQSGRAAVYPIFENAHERYRGPVSGAAAVRDQRVEWFKDLARTLDYLETRVDIDRGRMAMYGFSTNMLPIFLALDPRLKTGIAIGGTLDRGVPLPEVDPFHFAPRVTVPFLMLNGRHDAINPVETHQAPRVSVRVS